MLAMDFRLGAAADVLTTGIDHLARQRVVERIWAGDHTVWSDSEREITDRLGWLDIHERMLPAADHLGAWAAQRWAVGFRQVVLIGMGGSSLAPDMFQKIFGFEERSQAMQLHILDTTDPEQIAALEARLDLTTTLFLVATKSGSTVETLSGFHYFWQQVSRAQTGRPVGEHFVAITDPGSSLVDLARGYAFQHCFENDPNIGGRYSALSYFGLVPLALLQVDIPRVLQPVSRAADRTRRPPAANDAAQLGILMARLAQQGRDKLTLLLPPHLAALGDWLEQLIAESLGKEGVGIVPVLGEDLFDVACWGDDRFCVVIAPLTSIGDLPTDMVHLADRCQAAGHPTVVMPVQSVWDLGYYLFLWEFATAVAGYGLGVHPFDQPDVEAAKVAARTFMTQYEASGTLPPGDWVPAAPDVLETFCATRRPGDYLALQAYLPLNDRTTTALHRLRTKLSRTLGLAVTVGFGPRFLHSTGQLHKGGAHNGLYLQLLRNGGAEQDILIPSPLPTASPMTFGILQQAQALGDAAVLEAQGRRVLSLHLGPDPVVALDGLLS